MATGRQIKNITPFHRSYSYSAALYCALRPYAGFIISAFNPIAVIICEIGKHL